MAQYEGANWKAIEVWASTVAGFMFSHRICAIGSLEDRDVSFQDQGGERSITIVIRGSKTDHQTEGVRRTLMSTGCELRPVHTMAEWLGRKGWRPNGGEALFSRSIGRLINHILDELSAENGL